MGTGSTIRLFVKRVKNRINKELILIATTLFSGIVLAFLSRLESQWVIIFLAVIWGLVSGLYHPVVFELIADGTIDEDRGKGMGIRGTLGTMGSFTGIVIFSNLAEIWSVRTSILLSGITGVIGVILIEVWIHTDLSFPFLEFDV
uniref:Major facilitator superfamily MFS-1 n=1 Tax=uncultured organism TaxID=155900 RepID=M1Q1Q9_9ZZZZ|nr:major facilitator superfamily MFS-1 [uncultured organism]